ncbi:MGMT family protein [Paenibacillus chungangensis]|uniref:MGMT family protein n=1 Tax=Paenibacillus chungangensis TaxID=696535 RepID=A0ABW3HS88_9BACL
MQPFTKAVIDIIKAIPPGKVMTYGSVAALAGSPRAARQVVRILHAMSKKEGLPWHRIVNAKGEIALSSDEGRLLQSLYLRDEGVEVSEDGRLELARYLYRHC